MREPPLLFAIAPPTLSVSLPERRQFVTKSLPSFKIAPPLSNPGEPPVRTRLEREALLPDGTLKIRDELLAEIVIGPSAGPTTAMPSASITISP